MAHSTHRRRRAMPAHSQPSQLDASWTSYDGDIDMSSEDLEAGADSMSTSASQTQPDNSQLSQADGDNEDLWGALLPAWPDFPRLDFKRGQTTYTIGRATRGRVPAGANYTLDSDKLSRVHCSITWEVAEGAEASDQVVIEDVSQNGVWINNERMKKGDKFYLKQGHEISLTNSKNKMCFMYRHFGGAASQHSEHVEIFDKYHLSIELGRGAFASVRKAVSIEDGLTYAVKVINSRHWALDPGKRHFIEREIDILRRVDHPNIVRWIETFADLGAIYLVMEYVDGGDLLQFILKNNSGLPELQARYFTHNICSGAEFLHKHNIVHRDLKPENVLLTRAPLIFAKIADFGLAKIVDSQSQLLTQCGTPMYVAPEIFLGPREGYTEKVDSFCIGGIVIAMLTMSVPFPEPTVMNEQANIRRRIERREVDWEMLRGVSDDGASRSFARSLCGCSEVRGLRDVGTAVGFCKALMEKSPTVRMGMRHALMHPWLNDPYFDLGQGYAVRQTESSAQVRSSPQTLRVYRRSNGDSAEHSTHLYSSFEQGSESFPSFLCASKMACDMC
ncbi:kinase-like domain-containing protein [Auriculariales sp. MPI-PUGE-AT-0066]|nr:kinase-like domain-containing protein [Auriculariales sp. MPI-PUGE-AT-0066]